MVFMLSPGSMTPAKREVLWKEKRVFFLTPQVFQNDLGRGSCCADDVVCLVFDEAHKALGNYSYCQVSGPLLLPHLINKVSKGWDQTHRECPEEAVHEKYSSW